MAPKRGTDDIVVGAGLVALGALALREAWRLRALRTTLVAGAVVGDDTFPMLVGIGLVVVGLYLALVPRRPVAKVSVPTRAVRRQMLWGAGLLIAYWLALPALGYTASTAIASVGFFRAMGGYRWPIALLLAVVTAGALHVLFRVWLLQPLPTGVFGS